jgi:hypothetical protein
LYNQLLDCQMAFAEQIDVTPSFQIGVPIMAVPAECTFHLNSLSELELQHVEAELVAYRGRHVVRLVEHEGPTAYDPTIAIIAGSNFKDGVIEAEIAGAPRKDAPQDMRGFVGIAFRVQPHPSCFECFFLGPTNGRADDQLRRNHSTQYISHPDFHWYRLREESPGVYESYTDLVPGAWTPSELLCRVSGRSCLSTARTSLAWW